MTRALARDCVLDRWLKSQFSTIRNKLAVMAGIQLPMTTILCDLDPEPGRNLGFAVRDSHLGPVIVIKDRYGLSEDSEPSAEHARHIIALLVHESLHNIGPIGQYPHGFEYEQRCRKAASIFRYPLPASRLEPVHTENHPRRWPHDGIPVTLKQASLRTPRPHPRTKTAPAPAPIRPCSIRHATGLVAYSVMSLSALAA